MVNAKQSVQSMLCRAWWVCPGGEKLGNEGGVRLNSQACCKRLLN
jgi:hypothetical protein